MRGVEDDLAGDLAVGAAELAVEAGAVLEQHVAAVRVASRHLTELLDLLELGRVRRRRAARTAPSRRWSSTAPARSALCSPTSRFSSVRDPTASAATWTSTPSSSRSSDGLVDADVGLDPADERLVAPAEVEALGLGGREADLLERLDAVRQVLGDLGDRPPEPLAGTAR